MDQGNIWTKARQGAITFCWILSGAVSLYVFQNANRVEVKVDKMAIEQQTFIQSVREATDVQVAYEAATQNKLSAIAGEWKGAGYKEPSMLLANFVEQVRQQARADIEQKKGKGL